MEGILYKNILTEILSFGMYYIIQQEKEYGKQLIENITNCQNPYEIKKTIDLFFNKFNNNINCTDNYMYYLNKLYGSNNDHNHDNNDNNLTKSSNVINIIDSSSSVNHFSDDSEEDCDSENIIEIDRKFNF
jgi:hypothetical protein